MMGNTATELKLSNAVERAVGPDYFVDTAADGWPDTGYHLRLYARRPDRRCRTGVRLDLVATIVPAVYGHDQKQVVKAAQAAIAKAERKEIEP